MQRRLAKELFISILKNYNDCILGLLESYNKSNILYNVSHFKKKFKIILLKWLTLYKIPYILKLWKT